MYELDQEFYCSHKLIESEGKQYIFREPPASVRPKFQPVPLISTVSEAKRQKEQIRQLIKSLKLKEHRILQMMGYQTKNY